MMRKHFQSLRSTAFFSFLGTLILGFSACGSEDAGNQNPRVPSTFGGNSNDQKSCKTYLETSASTQDSDKDGLTDLQEAYGYTAMVGGTSVTFYSNPTLADTDGDGVSDKDEADQASALRSPAIRNYDLTLYATGGMEGFQTIDSMGHGWNYFSKLRVKKGDKITVKQIGNGTWGIAANLESNATGYSMYTLPNNADCSTQKWCISGEKYGALIGQLSSGFTSSSASSAPFKIGSLMNTTTLTFEDSTQSNFTDADTKYLFLRANDFGTTITDNFGNVRVMVTLSNSNVDYPMPPTGDLKTRIINSICPDGYRAP